MNNLLIVGAGGHGKVVLECALAMQKIDYIAFLDDNKVGEDISGYQVLG